MKKLILTILLAAGTMSVRAGYYGYPCGWGWGFYPSISFSVGSYPWYSAGYYPVYNYGVPYVRPAPTASSGTSSVVKDAPANTPAVSNAPPAEKTAPVSPAADPMSSANSLFGR